MIQLFGCFLRVSAALHAETIEAVALGMTPFLIGALVKAVIAAMAVKGGWALLDRR